jgi:putative hydroxymethylpyrimidine transport system ATP-binding protein
MTAPGIILDDVSLSFDQHALFSNLNCQFLGGQFTCILGPSGVGKSSLLRLIAGLHPTTSIRTSDNQDITKHIAYMSQSDSLLPWLNTLDNALLGARLRGEVTSTKRNQAIALLKRVGLKNPKQKVEELSGGMRQRVALVRTLLEDKPIVLMDEPFSALDVITRLDLQDLAAELLKNKTVILVTHDPLEALRLGHVIYVLSGMPVQLGAPIIPDGATPRATTSPELLELQGKLLARLQHAQEVTS